MPPSPVLCGARSQTQDFILTELYSQPHLINGGLIFFNLLSITCVCVCVHRCHIACRGDQKTAHRNSLLPAGGPEEQTWIVRLGSECLLEPPHWLTAWVSTHSYGAYLFLSGVSARSWGGICWMRTALWDQRVVAVGTGAAVDSVLDSNVYS